MSWNEIITTEIGKALARKDSEWANFLRGMFLPAELALQRST